MNCETRHDIEEIKSLVKRINELSEIYFSGCNNPSGEYKNPCDVCKKNIFEINDALKELPFNLKY